MSNLEAIAPAQVVGERRGYHKNWCNSKFKESTHDTDFEPRRDFAALVACEEWNLHGSRTAVLLHGRPDSMRSWSTIAPGLSQEGWRVLVPALRGFLPTKFLRDDTPRTGQLTALVRDLL